MSLIFGILHFKSEQVENYLELLKDGCSCFKSIRTQTWNKKQVGLGNILRYNTPESVFEQTPHTLDNCTITSYSRIDNREKLIKDLDFLSEPIDKIPDSLIILKAYQKWDEDCVHHLEGDWVFAIWDEEKQKLFISCDHMGNHGLYYYHSKDYFIFCSSIKGLLAINEIPKIANDLYIAGILAVSKPSGGQTAYENIFNILPATNITVQNTQIIKKRYWVLENIKPKVFKSFEDCIEQFLAIYTNAIKERIRTHGPIATMLSGGLDSGSVSVLTARELKKENRRLNSYTYIPLYDTTNLCNPNRFGNEKEFAQATADFCGNIDIHFIDGRESNLLDGLIKSIDIHDAPVHAVSNAIWITELLQTAEKKGVSTLLTGQAGNGSISWAGMHKPYSLKLLLKEYKENGLKDVLKGFVKMLLPRRKKTTTENWQRYSLINDQFKLRTRISELKKESLRKKNKNIDESVHLRSLILNPLIPAGIAWQENAFAYNMHIVDPTKDKELVEFCLSIPDHFFYNSTQNRLIIRSAMDKILPENIRLNKKKGLQSADAIYRFREIADQIQNLIKELDQSPRNHDYLDFNKIDNAFNLIIKGEIERTKNPQIHSLLRALGIGIHLKKKTRI
jgi:asparagine synthase (glutamine-hydrolysing)